jgi:cell division protein FtsW (lipid II flippase)
MTTDQTDEKPAGKSGVPDASSKAAASRSTARIAIIVAIVVFLAGGFIACHCPSVFVVIGICSAVALAKGSRWQKVIAIVLLCVAIVGFVIEFRAVRNEKMRLQERSRRIMESQNARPQTE